MMLASGCTASEDAPPPDPPDDTHGEPPAPVPVVSVAPETPASEPDVVVLPSGRTLVCALPQRASMTMLVYKSDDGETFSTVEMPREAALVDCALGVDVAGRAYFASSGGATLVLAASADGESFARDVARPASAGGYDRPWIAGGEADRAVAIAFDVAQQRVVALATRDGGATWSTTVPATPVEQPTFQSFGNLAWLGGDAFAFPYAVLEQVGLSVEARDLWLATSEDGGATWDHAPVAQQREGNVGHIFPSIASADGATVVAWAEERDETAPQVLASFWLGEDWAPPMIVHPENATGVLPRALVLDGTPGVAYYRAEGLVDPQQEEATWSFVLSTFDMTGWHDVVEDAAAHNGTITTGGYGTLPRELLQGGGTQNARDLLHNVGAWWDATRGGARLAWTRTGESASEPRVVTALVPT